MSPRCVLMKNTSRLKEKKKTFILIILNERYSLISTLQSVATTADKENLRGNLAPQN